MPISCCVMVMEKKVELASTLASFPSASPSCTPSSILLFSSVALVFVASETLDAKTFTQFSTSAVLKAATVLFSTSAVASKLLAFSMAARAAII